MVATSAVWGAVIRTRREDVSEDLAFVRIRGTKRKTRDRVVPIVTKDQGTRLKYALEHAQEEKGQLFLDWQNVRRDLRAACAKLEIPRCSPNDLRRTCATWLRAAGTPPHLIAPLMGHADSRLVERVYGRLEPVTLAKLIAKATGSTSANAQQTERDSVDLVDRLDARRSASSSEMAPRAGIEPATHGLTVRVSAQAVRGEDRHVARVESAGVSRCRRQLSHATQGLSLPELVTALVRRPVHTWVPVLMSRARRRATARTTPVSRLIRRSRTAERLWPRLSVEIVDAHRSRSSA